MSPKAHENFKRVEKEKNDALEARKAAETQAETFKTQVAEREKRIQDLEATMAQQRANTGNVDGLQATLQERDQTIRALQQELKAAAITRDPEFVDRYVNRREFQEETLADLGTAVGSRKRPFTPQSAWATSPSWPRSGMRCRRRSGAVGSRAPEARADSLEREQAERMRTRLGAMQKQRQEGLRPSRPSRARKPELGEADPGDISGLPESRKTGIVNDHLANIAEGFPGGNGSKDWRKDKIVEPVMMVKVYENGLRRHEQPNSGV